MRHLVLNLLGLVSLLVLMPSKASAQGDVLDEEDAYSFEEDEMQPPEEPSQAPPQAQEQATISSAKMPWHLGFRAGAHYDLLPQPNDPKGEPTLLGGTAFDGLGWSVGVTGRWAWTQTMTKSGFAIEANLLYTNLSGDGFIKDPQTNQSQTITLSTSQLQLPVLMQWRGSGSGTFEPFLGLGPQINLGFSSNAAIENEGVPDAPKSLETESVIHLGATAAGGVAFNVGELKIPVEFRMHWDPMMPSSTRDRFNGYQSMQELGVYQVGFNWQYGMMVGVEMPL